MNWRNSRLDQIEGAFAALGKRLAVEAQDTAWACTEFLIPNSPFVFILLTMEAPTGCGLL